MTSGPSERRRRGSRVGALGLGLGLGLAACRPGPRPPADPAQPPAIFVDPSGPGDDVPAVGPGPDGAAGPAIAAPDDPPRAGPTITPIPPEPGTPGFRDTLEGMTSGPRARGHAGVEGVGACEGGRRQVGESWAEACNTCVCEASGEVTCTLMACVGGGDGAPAER